MVAIFVVQEGEEKKPRDKGNVEGGSFCFVYLVVILHPVGIISGRKLSEIIHVNLVIIMV